MKSVYISFLRYLLGSSGSRSDPLAPTPAELVYGATVALGFGTIAVAFILAFIGIGTTQAAAALSLFYHAAFGAHIGVRWTSWKAFVHVDAPTVNAKFFLASHVVFALLAGVLFLLPTDAAVARRRPKGA
jgi:hypothetical protein